METSKDPPYPETQSEEEGGNGRHAHGPDAGLTDARLIRHGTVGG